MKVERGVDPSLDREATRVVKSMPHWIPGKQNGNVSLTFQTSCDLQTQQLIV